MIPSSSDRQRTGMNELVYYYPQGHAAHHEPGHPERPERVEAIRQALENAGWWKGYPHLNAMQVPEEILQRVHRADYLRSLQAACASGMHLDADTYTTPQSWELALSAAGGAISVAAAVWQASARRGFALTRPPGHHATSRRGMGFCLLNNVAIAAEYLIQIEGARSVAIIDLDLHHGNGTQDIFWERGDVLYISTHQSPLYPGTGWIDETGAGAGLGMNMNIPLPPGSGDQAFDSAMHSLILPILEKTKPQMLLVSFGFDPHWRDPLGHLQLSAAGYARLIADLASWADQNCQGKLALVLEGGYDLEAAQACATCVTASLLGQPVGDPIGPSPRPEGRSWQSLIRQIQNIWSL